MGETAFDPMALSAALEKVVTDLKFPNGPRKPLINYELYCRSCQHYWSQAEYDLKPLKCKNGHLTVRILAQYEIFEDSFDSDEFGNIHGILLE